MFKPTLQAMLSVRLNAGKFKLRLKDYKAYDFNFFNNKSTPLLVALHNILFILNSATL